MVEMLSSDQCPTTAGDLRKALNLEEAFDGIEPEDFWNLGDTTGYAVQIRWSGNGDVGSYDVVFVRRKYISADNSVHFSFDASDQGGVSKSLSEYASNPLQGIFMSNIVPQLRALLERKLPAYMMPSVFMLLDALPLTPNGKLDRKALPSPDTARPARAGGYRAPRCEIEKVLVGLWAEILRLERVSIDDDFFDLGGHSLLATQLISRIRGAFGLDLPLRSLFESPTAANYAEYVEAVQWTSAEGLDTVGKSINNLERGKI